MAGLLQILWGRKVVIAVCVLAAAAASGVVSWLLPPSYVTSATLLVSEPKVDREVLSPVEEIEYSVDSFRAIIKDPSFEREVMRKLGLDAEPHNLTLKGFGRMVDVFISENTKLIRIRVRASDPALAREIANGIAEIFVDTYGDLLEKELAAARSYLRVQIDATEAMLREERKRLEDFQAEEGIARLNLRMTGPLVRAYEDRLTLTGRLTRQVVEAQLAVDAGEARAAFWGKKREDFLRSLEFGAGGGGRGGEVEWRGLAEDWRRQLEKVCGTGGTGRGEELAAIAGDLEELTELLVSAAEARLKVLAEISEVLLLDEVQREKLREHLGRESRLEIRRLAGDLRKLGISNEDIVRFLEEQNDLTGRFRHRSSELLDNLGKKLSVLAAEVEGEGDFEAEMLLDGYSALRDWVEGGLFPPPEDLIPGYRGYRTIERELARAELSRELSRSAAATGRRMVELNNRELDESHRRLARASVKLESLLDQVTSRGRTCRYLREKHDEIELNLASKMLNVFLATPAIRPEEPAWPRPGLNMLIAGVLSLLVTSAFIVHRANSGR